MKEKLARTIDLKNGLKLDFFDVSRRVGADTWLVVLVARVDVAVDDSLFEHHKPSDVQTDTIDVDSIRQVLGDGVCFEVRTERNFINETQKDNVLEQLQNSFIATNYEYLSNKDFPVKFVLKKYRQTQSV